ANNQDAGTAFPPSAEDVSSSLRRNRLRGRRQRLWCRDLGSGFRHEGRPPAPHSAHPHPPNLSRAPDVTSEALPAPSWDPEPTEETNHRLAASDRSAAPPAPSWDPEPTEETNPRLACSVR